LYRIGLSAVVDDIITVERRDCHFGRARLQALLADLAATRLSCWRLAGATIIDDGFSTR
jgi:hypothetical protein